MHIDAFIKKKRKNIEHLRAIVVAIILAVCCLGVCLAMFFLPVFALDGQQYSFDRLVFISGGESHEYYALVIFILLLFSFLALAFFLCSLLFTRKNGPLKYVILFLGVFAALINAFLVFCYPAYRENIGNVSASLTIYGVIMAMSFIGSFLFAAVPLLYVKFRKDGPKRKRKCLIIDEGEKR